METKHIDLVDMGISLKEYGKSNNIKYSTCKRCINIVPIVEKEYLQKYISHWLIVEEIDTCKSIFHIGLLFEEK